MSSKHKARKTKNYSQQNQQGSIAVDAVIDMNAQNDVGFIKRARVWLNQISLHTQKDDMAKIRWIAIFVVMMLTVEFTVIALALTASPASPLNKNSGQLLPLKSDSSGYVCSPGADGSGSNGSLNPQSPGGSLQYSPSPINQSSGLNGADTNNLQASPQPSQCFN